jgi:hypothetical protein
MKMFTRSRVRIAFLCAGLVAISALFAAFPITALQQSTQRAAAQGYLSGTVRSSAGPEAGVWVIAETKDLPTGFIKIVVTDDQGRYMLPELPDANYNVWVRGYGLVDSTPVKTKPVTSQVNLTAVVAKTPQEAAKVYPGNYWMSMMEAPPKSMFPGTGDQGNGIGTNMPTQENWVHTFKSSCNFCHQLGNPITRTLDHVFKAKPELKTSSEAWDYRLRTGVRGSGMSGSATSLGRGYMLKMLSEWTDRIGKGEVPQAPPRPQGAERNVVLSLWYWGTDHSFMHDEVSTSKQNPRVNSGGAVYAVSAGHGTLVRLDPYTSETTEIEIPTRQARAEVTSRFPAPNPPSLWWGSQHLWSNPPYNPADPHNPMIDSKGRVWLTSKIRNQAPPWCADAKISKFADYFPLRGGGRQASYYDPKTQKFQLIETCYATHHLQFDTDPDETVYFNELSGPIFGWVDSKIYDQTLAATKDEIKAEQAAVGWCPQVVDTNGDGVITKPWNVGTRGPDIILYQSDTAGGGGGSVPAPARGQGGGGGGQGRGRGANNAPATPFDPKLDTMISYSLYSVIPSPADDSVWGVSESFPGYLVRLMRGNNAPTSCKTQLFKVPAPGLDPRGVDVDTNGVVWAALAASSHLASFDVRKCKDLGGPGKTDGSQCQEGWSLYQTTGPRFKGTEIPTDFHYFGWVDQQDVGGFGKNTPMATGSNSDSLLVLNPQTRQWLTLRVPYPLGFYSRGMDGRIDDPNAGWKGRGLWANYGTHFVWHIEGGKGTKGKMVKFQIRPNPLAR